MASGRRVLIGLQLQCAKALQNSLLVPIPIHFSETMIWKDNKKSRIRAVQVDNLRDLLGIRRMDKVPNARIRELCGVTKEVEERIDEGVIDGSIMWRGWRTT